VSPPTPKSLSAVGSGPGSGTVYCGPWIFCLHTKYACAFGAERNGLCFSSESLLGLQRTATLWHANQAVCSVNGVCLSEAPNAIPSRAPSCFRTHTSRYSLAAPTDVRLLTLVNICTASLTFSNSTFCPHTLFMCFVWISEQTAIISLYSINWLVFITGKESVYCAVRTEF
jgi:hypothetical protein